VVREALTPEMIDALEPREVAALFVSRRAEGLNASEENLLAGWLARDESHRLLLESAERAWKAFAEPQGDEILAAMRAHALKQRPRGWAAWRPVAAAAAVLLLMGGTALVVIAPWAPDSRTTQPPVLAATVHYTSLRGEVKELTLPDGSRMTLDADSTAIGHFGEGGRSIELQRGRAYFDVVTDHNRPFSVAAAERSVVAVGTRFDVNLTADGVTVTLIEGRVDVGSQDDARAPIRLESGQQYISRGDDASVRTIGSAADNVIAWRTGLVNFDEQTLGEAAAIMNRYSGTQIVIDDPAVASLRVSGQFRAGDARRFADTLADMHKLEAVVAGGQIELVRKK
jgi:transmembrane sensor